ncbi:pyruvate carboxylase [Deferribacter desulfuricans SSM1]|uniref:Pyruvate carboxylase n=1 Tax=Deferribacter desulfuricans (strain DSM 14783 / JCM 11476 / NBRC 101012 / SSM1) TaxID=639282 RepID=D3PDR9_DEFDS|nr:pyruvate carboxylase [Deferribacter desulfuricans]BAI80742.1 pyruvate carboxylase [Deferribacter desulfuricans SSM1]
MKKRKILAANRGEIAIRIFRAATELGFSTVAIYSEEDKYSLHRYKADEAYFVGKGLDPVSAYLNIDEIVDLCVRKKIEFVHPGYGFLAESYEFAEKCQKTGIKFIGPSPETIKIFGDKKIAKDLAKECGVPVIEGSDIINSLEEAKSLAKSIGYPLMIKATAGGGGRGIRIVHNEKELAENFDSAKSEAFKAFANDDVILEKYIEKPKHIEVQLLADKYGNIVHLYERDCSIQRRHQKLIEIAPAFTIPEKVLNQMYEAAIEIGKKSHLVSAATVEFLVDKNNNFYFLEVNPRIQVEHTITELVTGVDIVQSQIFIADGKKLSDKEINLKSQKDITKHGYSIQCRITTEDPENNFMPDTGTLEVYRSASGFGIRLDAGNAYTNAKITPYYDSLLVKVSSWAITFEQAAKKMLRALSEFRVRGVKTNIQFLENVISHPNFLSGNFDTTFVDNTKELFVFRKRRDRATKALKFLGNNIVNNPSNAKIPDDMVLPEIKPPVIKYGEKIPAGTRDILLRRGVEGVLDFIQKSKETLFTDTTFRDAHQSLLATRLRTFDMLQIADAYAHHMHHLFSLEMWGGATFDVAYRFLKESPWERLRLLKDKIPNILFQMLIRASNAVGYTNYPDNVVKKFIELSAKNGIDVFRIFDCFNWTAQIIPVIEEVKKQGKIAEAAICYTGDILDTKRDKYSLKYYVNLAKELADAGTDILAIKDMAGLVKPYAAKKLIKAIKEETGLPIHFHTHDTSGNGESAILMAIESGADIVDAAISSMSGLTSQPNLNSIVAALDNTEHQSSIDKEWAQKISDYFERVRRYYFPFESGLKAATAEVYEHEIPGGQYSNLVVQVEALGLLDRWEEVRKMYKEVNEALGDIIKVTPSSKVVGDLALFLVRNNLTINDLYEKGDTLSFPDSVVSFFKGYLGQPYGGFNEKLQKIVLKDEKPITCRPGELLEPFDFEKAKKELESKFKNHSFTDEDLISYALYPKVFEDYIKFVDEYGDGAIFDTKSFFYPLKPGEEISVDIEEGKTLIIKYIGVSEVDEKGYRRLFFELNGQPRTVSVKDEKISDIIKSNVKGDITNPKHICATMPGKIVKIFVKEGDEVKKGDLLVITEAMKIETKINANCDGKVEELLLHEGDKIEAGDLILKLS